MSLEFIDNAAELVFVVFDELFRLSSLFKLLVGVVVFLFIFFGVRQWFFKR